MRRFVVLEQKDVEEGEGAEPQASHETEEKRHPENAPKDEHHEHGEPGRAQKPPARIAGHTQEFAPGLGSLLGVVLAKECGRHGGWCSMATI
jgi:hypothetical protein